MKIRILHIITKLDIGGAQQNTIYNVEHLNKLKNFYSEIVAGPVIEEENLVQYAKDRKIKVTIIEGITNNIRPLKNILGLIKTYRYIKKNNFTIVHTHSSVAGIIGRIAARIAKTPIIIHTVHGWGIRPDMPKIKQILYIWLERFCERFTDRMVVVSRFNIDKGLGYGFGKRSKYAVVHSGIDVERFSRKIDVSKKRIELGLDADRPVVGMIGRLDTQKNPLDFVKVAYLVQKKYSDAQFIIVGDGPLRGQTEAMIKKLKVREFHLLGFRDDVDEIIKIMDISVLTSLWEGLPRVFPESMAAKKPIVAYNVDGAPEAIIDGKNGYLIPSMDKDLLAKKILYLLKNPETARQMGIEGYMMVDLFSLNKMLEDIDSLYEKLLKEKVG